MKTKLLLLCIVAWLCWSCNDQCKETRVVRRFSNVTHSLMELRTQVKVESPRALEQPGKMYAKGKYLYVNEIKRGIHIIDNGNPASPKFVTFINIPGNGMSQSVTISCMPTVFATLYQLTLPTRQHPKK